MEDADVKLYESAGNHIFPGLQMFVRDTFLSKEIEEKYLIGKIIREPTYCDTSARVGGLLTTHRFAILSNRFVDFGHFEHDTNWGLYVCKSGSFFKILDVFKVEDKTQIVLLHLDDNWKLFEDCESNIEQDIVKMSRERFLNKFKTPPIPELATKKWLERLLYPVGVDLKGNYSPLEGIKISKNADPKVIKQIQYMDKAIDKALEFIEERNRKKD